MRYLLIFLAVLLVAWGWRAFRTSLQQSAQRKNNEAPPAVAMVRCAHCGVHMPSTDALTGDKGVYCSTAHLHQAEP